MATQAAMPLNATPAAGQIIEHDGKTYETVREGQAYILIPPNTQRGVDPKAKVKADDATLKPQNVFYNPIQQFNRDLSVLCIRAFGEDWVHRKRRRNEKNKEKASRKGNKKRKITEAETNGVQDIGEEDGGVKLRKASDGSPVALQRADTTTEVPSNSGSAADIRNDSTSVEQSTQATGEAAVSSRGEEGASSHQHATKQQGPSFRILDALSATGLRALRYAKEIPFVTSVVANDMNSSATKSMRLNIQHNDLSSAITTNTGDAIGHMYGVAYPPSGSHGPHHINKRYDVIDLDPYGTAAPFIDAALQSLNEGGLLCVTCTDSGVFASTGYCEKTFALYGGMPVKGSYSHEAGLRLIINSVATAAAKYGLAIEPLLSLSIDFYARVFIRVRRSPADVKFLAGKTMVVYCCDSGCSAWSTNMFGRNTKQKGKADNDWYKHSIAQAPGADRHCEHCGNKTHIAGPMWGGPIHNAAFIEKVLEDLHSVDTKIYETKPRIEGMLTTALDELLVNPESTKYIPSKERKEDDEIIPQIPPDVVDPHPFYINLSALSKVLHCIAPGSDPIRGALRHAGYIATRSHCQPGSIKTNAPWTLLWEMMREWVRQKQPVKEGAIKENTAGWKIMQKARKENADADASAKDDAHRIRVIFDEALGKDRSGKRLVRYQQNPRENWGPMTKAKGSG